MNDHLAGLTDDEAQLRLQALLVASRRQVSESHGWLTANGCGSRLDDAVRLMTGLGPSRTVRPSTPRVVQDFLADAVASAPEHTRDLAIALEAATPHLQWVHAYPNASSHPELTAWRASYSYTLLAAAVQPGGSAPADAPYLSDELLFGFTLQGPDVTYPKHNHDAVEIYGVISGNAHWFHPTQGWPSRPPGSVMVHESRQIHAMATNDEPLLTWVAWVTHPTSRAHLQLD